MESNPLIRRAVPFDGTETAAVFSAALRSMSFFPKLHSDVEDRQFIADLIEQAEFWVAEEDDQIVGLACIQGNWLAHLYVRPDCRSHGIGTALLNHVKTHRPEGFQFWTFQANMGARRFYERHGCKAVEFTDGNGNAEKLPDIRFVWPHTISQPDSLESPLDSSASASGSADV